jgi:hypothetical protein
VALLEEVEERELVERPVGLPDPVVALEDDVAVEPRDLLAVIGEPPQREVEEALLLSHDVAPLEVDEDVGVARPERERAVERELHRHERDGEPFPEAPVVLDPTLVPGGVEIAGDGPQGLTTRSRHGGSPKPTLIPAPTRAPFGLPVMALARPSHGEARRKS